MRYLLLSILAILPSLIAASDSALSDIQFRHLTIHDGLSDNEINDITQDSQGFMWISTSHGLCRYDGYRFKNFQCDRNSPESLPFHNIAAVSEDATGIMWVDFGFERYITLDPAKDKFVKAEDMLSNRDGITEKPAKIFVDTEKDLWVETTDRAIYHVDFGNNRTIKVENVPATNSSISSFCSDNDGVTAIYHDGHIIHIDGETNTVDRLDNYLQSHNDSNFSIYGIHCDNDGDYWINSKNGAWLYKAFEKQWIKITGNPASPFTLTGRYVRSFTSDSLGRIWAAIDNNGICVIDKKTSTVKHIQNDISDQLSLSDNSVNCVYVDDIGGVWIGTYKHGVSYYNDNMFRCKTDNFREFHSVRNFTPDVSTVAEDNNGNLWFGINGFLIKTNRDTKTKELIKLPVRNEQNEPVTVIVSMLIDRNDCIWLATYNSGLMSFAANTFRHHVLDPENPNSIANRTIWSIAEDATGQIWVGTWGAGLYRIDPDTQRAKHIKDSQNRCNDDEIVTITASDDKNIYMGSTYGLNVYNPQTDKFEKLLGNRKRDQLFSSSLMVQVYEDSRDMLWVCTRDGLNIYDRRNDEVIVPVEDLNHTIIQGIAEDNDKNMWVSTPNGLYHIVVNTDPQTKKYTFSHHIYDSVNPTQRFGFNPRGIIKHSSGTIVNCGINGISLIDPSNLKFDTNTPNIYFTDIQLFNRDVKIDSIYDGVKVLDNTPSHADELKLRYSQNVFSVTFSSLNYVSPDKIEYLYKLEGFDSEWTKTNSNKLTYTNLAPGNYTLKVKAINGDGYASNRAAELKIKIMPPFWQSWPAYIIYALLFLGVILIIRIYLRHNERHKYELISVQQEARQKHELDDMKLRFFTNISHDLRTPLTLILTPLEYVIAHTDKAELKDKLVIARNNALRLLGMVNQLLDFRKSDMNGHNLNATRGNIIDSIQTICNNFTEYSEYRNINLTFFSPVKSLYMMFDNDKIGKIMMNLLSNAFKFTPEGGRVDVSIDLAPSTVDTPEMLEIRVADNGCGISDEHKNLIFDRFYQVPHSQSNVSTGSGVGLNLVHEFVTLHNGTITVCDNIGKGSVFIVSIPVIRPEESAEESITSTDDAVETPDNNLPEPDDAAESWPQPKDDDKRPVILVVDDNDDFRKFMKDCLKDEYKVFEAADGEKAWNIIPDLQPDIIISDVMMPVMDGNELCRRVKNDIRTSHILIILLTARAAKEHELAGLENGADDYIIKPFNLNILTQRIKNLLHHRRNTVDISPSRINITPLDEKLMQKAIRYVEANIDRSDLSVEELSGELGMSRVHLYKKMVSISGKTPIEFIRIIRLKRAAQLLAESQLSIAEVTYQTGFNNLSLFRKYFKNEFGVLPSEYQSKHGKKYNESI